MEIRELGRGDGRQLIELFAAAQPDSPTGRSAPHDGPEAFLADPGSFVLGAYVEGLPVGFAWGLQMRSPSGRLTTYLHELHVHGDRRRQGIGAALVTAAMDSARQRGSTRFWLSTGAHNLTAQGLYEMLGGDRKPLGDVNYWWDLG